MVRRSGWGVATVVVAGLLAACTPGKPTATPTPSTNLVTVAPSAIGGSPGVVGAAPVWKPCPELAQEVLKQPIHGFTLDCASIAVPQDWHKPDSGQTFSIAMVRVRSANQTNRIGSLVVNPGGPGGSGVELAVGLTQQLPTAITDRFDILGFDPRGVGRSTEIQCFTPSAEDSLFGAEPDPATQADFDAVVALTKKAAAPCGAKYGDKLSLFSTEQAARDIDAIRVAVGDKKLSYLGYSYGTLLGATYAQLFPKNIRAMVLDGAIDPKQGLIARSEGQAGGFEHAFDDFSTWCKQNAAKCPIHADPRGAVLAAMASARTNPVPYTDGRKATAGWILVAVSQSMYAQFYWEYLGQAIDNLSRGDARLTMAIADDYAERAKDGTYTNLFDANDAVNCTDDANQPTVAQVRQYQLDWRKKYPLFGGPLAVGLLSCAVGDWPGRSDPYPTGKAVGAPPIVVVGTTGDPATPYAQTARLAQMLGVGHVLTWDGEGHTAYPQTACIKNAVDAYLIDLKVPAAGLVCPKS